jgi:hypothetical protein
MELTELICLDENFKFLLWLLLWWRGGLTAF